MYSFDDSCQLIYETYLFAMHTMFLPNIMELYLVQSIKKIKLQRLNNIADKSKNLLSLHNSPRPLKI